MPRRSLTALGVRRYSATRGLHAGKKSHPVDGNRFPAGNTVFIGRLESRIILRVLLPTFCPQIQRRADDIGIRDIVAGRDRTMHAFGGLRVDIDGQFA